MPLKSFVIIPAVLLALAGSASGCFTADSFSTVFFNSSPERTNEPVVAMISITRIIDQPASRNRSDTSVPVGDVLAEAKILKVIKGELSEQSIFVVAPGTTCDEVLKVGASGIVAGRLRINQTGQWQLIISSHRINDTR